MQFVYIGLMLICIWLSMSAVGSYGFIVGGLIGGLLCLVVSVIATSITLPARERRWTEEIEHLKFRLKVQEDLLRSMRMQQDQMVIQIKKQQAQTKVSSAPIETLPIIIPKLEEPAAKIPKLETPTPIILKLEEPAAKIPKLETPIILKLEEPNPMATWLIRFFTGDRSLVRIGVVLLLIGVGFLLKYAVDQGFISLELRLIGVALGGFALLYTGWKLRLERPLYGFALQGGGLGVLYLTFYAAYALPQNGLQQILPPELALALCILTGGGAMLLSIPQNAQVLAVLGILGGFSAPLLISSHSSGPVALFAFYALLNLVILGIAWFKLWRNLNILGFVFTFVIAGLWGNTQYQPDQLISTEVFVILFFLFYSGLPLLYALRKPRAKIKSSDGALLFGTPFVTFAYQANLLNGYSFALGWSCAAMGLFYLGVWFWLRTQQAAQTQGTPLAFYKDVHLALGLGFLAAAVPLCTGDFNVTLAIWLAKGLGLWWLGVRSDRVIPRVFGVILQVLVAVLWFFIRDLQDVIALPYVHVYAHLIALSALLSAALAAKPLQSQFALSVKGWSLWALLWWFIPVGGLWAQRFGDLPREIAVNYLAFFILSSLLLQRLSKPLELPWLRFPALALLPVALGVALSSRLNQDLPAAWGWAGIIWLALIPILYDLLVRLEGDSVWDLWQDGKPWSPSSLSFNTLHLIGTLFFTTLLGWDLSYLMREVGSLWTGLAWAWVLLLLLLGMVRQYLRYPNNPNNPNAREQFYLSVGARGVAGFLLVWFVYAQFHYSPDPKPLLYVPLINPLELTLFASLTAAIALLTPQGVKRLNLEAALPTLISRLTAKRALIALGLLLLTMMVLRPLNIWFGEPLELESLLRSTTVQPVLSITWTLAALVGMVYANRRKRREYWLIGAGLLAVVVVKLILLDLAAHGTLQRIVSFIGVGLLFMLISYVAPVPPKTEALEPNG